MSYELEFGPEWTEDDTLTELIGHVVLWLALQNEEGGAERITEETLIAEWTDGTTEGIAEIRHVVDLIRLAARLVRDDEKSEK